VAAAIVDAVVSAPTALALPLVRPDNIAEAIAELLLSLNMLVGYVGGRVAARAGLSHEDSRSQWTMASVVSGVSIIIAVALEKLRHVLHLVHAPVQGTPNANPDSALLARFLLHLVMMLLLIRFGYAMGTYSQAKREGRVQDEDEASEG
jgi:hypothetical protein